MLLQILKFPDSRLRTKCEPVTDFGPLFQKNVEAMFETMYDAPGIGLAAIQVGIFQRFLVMDIGENEGEVIKRHPMVLVNPVILSREGEIVWEEGCLSCPDLVVPVNRSQKIEVEFLDREGNPQKMFAEDLIAVCIQHEIDHLDGILIFDKLTSIKKNLYRQKVKRGSEEFTPKRPVVR